MEQILYMRWDVFFPIKWHCWISFIIRNHLKCQILHRKFVFQSFPSKKDNFLIENTHLIFLQKPNLKTCEEWQWRPLFELDYKTTTCCFLLSLVFLSTVGVLMRPLTSFRDLAEVPDCCCSDETRQENGSLNKKPSPNTY